jgi:hypothetical protein
MALWVHGTKYIGQMSIPFIVLVAFHDRKYRENMKTLLYNVKLCHERIWPRFNTDLALVPG